VRPLLLQVWGSAALGALMQGVLAAHRL